MKYLKLDKKYFLFLLLLSFVFISSTSLAMSGNKEEIAITPLPNEVKTKKFSPNPVLINNSKTFPIISAQAALAIDLDSMTPLYEKNPNLILLPASTTKIVTALVAMDYYNDNDILRVSGVTRDGQDMGLVEGEEISAGSLLDALLINSANDAAEALAINYLGGKEAFVEAMNGKANFYNLENSHFDNPVGFDGNNHYSTVKDLIRISIEAMQNSRFSQRVRQTGKIVTSSDGRIIHKLSTTNKLLGSVEGVKGIKTGWTENARENLITYLERDNKRIMFALLGSQDRFGETEEIINWILENYKWEEVIYPPVQ